ncbi:MAG: EscI/YscI/HrpB family type III secretion system inner rod protein [Puniceicoccales bacterium]|jgi:hypothetical protein|nr:EscI/YscI/HrpB family type III secretion system inner rod protein [Puniceicoccales bacterium]
MAEGVQTVTNDGAGGAPTGVQMVDVSQFLADFHGAGSRHAAQATDGGGSVYSRMLAPLSDFRAGFDRIVGDITNLVGHGSLSMGDLIQVQFQLTQLAYMNDLSAKTADKASQGVQTLFRNQG